MGLDPLTFDKSVKQAVGILSKPPYALEPSDFRNNPDKCFQEFFLSRRYVGAEDLASQIPDFSCLTNIIYQNDTDTYRKEFEKGVLYNISREHEAVMFMLNKLLQEKNYNSDVYLFYVLYSVVMKADDYQSLLGNLFETVSVTKEWERDLLWCIMWFADIDGFRAAVNDYYLTVEGVLRSIGDTSCSLGISLIDNCAVFIGRQLYEMSAIDNPNILFNFYLIERSVLARNIEKSYPDFKSVNDAISETNSKLMSIILFLSSSDKDEQEKMVSEMAEALRKELLQELQKFIDKHDDRMNNIDYVCYYMSTIMFDGFLYKDEHILEQNKQMISFLEGYIKTKNAENLIAAFAEFIGDEESAVARLKQYCTALWYSDYENFQKRALGVAFQLEQLEPKNKSETSDSESENLANQLKKEIKDIENSVEKGQIFKFGHYKQKDDTENEPIEWICLTVDNNSDIAMLVSKKVLDAKPFCDEAYVLERFGKNNEIDWNSAKISWENSTLRSWLNSVFLNQSFSPDERKYLAEDGVRDKVSLLTLEDVLNPQYGFSESKAQEDKNRSAVPTQYAQKHGVKAFGDEGTCIWWLRTRGSCDYEAAMVRPAGEVDSDGSVVTFAKGGIRPVIRVKNEGLHTK